MVTSGTKEWASRNVNCFFGCSNGCLYCYAKKMALRFGRKKDEKEWLDMIPNEKTIMKRFRYMKDRIIMFPSSHDLTPDTMKKWSRVLEKLMLSNNKVLVVTKGHPLSIHEVCRLIKKYDYGNKIELRITITSAQDEILAFWEPYAPNLDQRIAALQYAYNAGYKTSISMEPFLSDPEEIISLVSPYVTGDIWIGPMGYISQKITQEEKPYYDAVRELCQRENLEVIYERLKNMPNIQFKDRFRKMLGDKYERTD